MSTNASISLMNKDGSLDTIYNHWDGYLFGLGYMLTHYYTKVKKVRDLIALGNVSSVDVDLIPTEATHSFDNPQKGVTIAYGRDRGDSNQEAKRFDTLEDFCKSCMVQEYNYIFKDGDWLLFKVEKERPTKIDDFINISRLM